MRRTRSGWLAMVMTAGIAFAAVPALRAEPPRRDSESAVLAPGLQAALEAASKERGMDLFDGRCGPCLLARWEVCNARGAWPEAEATARQAIAGQSSPEILTAAHNRLGISLYKMGDLAAAAEAWRKAADLNGPEAAEALANLGLLAVEQGRYADAVAAARTALDRRLSGGPVLARPRVVICRARAGSGGTIPAPEGSGEIYSLGHGNAVEKPQKIYAVPPVYTEKARKARIRGIAILEAVIDREGCVDKLHVLKGLPYGLDRAAYDAVRQWVFEPATLEGQPVKVYWTLTVNFDIQQPKPPAGDSR